MHAVILAAFFSLLLQAPPPCQITLSKTPSQATYHRVGERIRYDYVFTNTGTLVLQGPFWVEDSRTLARYPQPLPEWWFPGEALHAFSEYDIVAGDMQRDKLTNAAFVWGPCRSNTAWASVINKSRVRFYMPILIRPEVTP